MNHDSMDTLRTGDHLALARCISSVENETAGYQEILQALSSTKNIPVIGITGPAGAGKSTLLNGIISVLTRQNKRVGVLAVDPTSPFTHGALLGDRVRMSSHHANPNVFIRSLATRGALGGLSAKTIEITDVMKEAGFDYVFVETVGVGQSEVEIASLADTTVLVLVPGAGDGVQALKSGIMEIADIFVVNKCDREGASALEKQILEHLDLKNSAGWIPPIVKTVAHKEEGIEALIEEITKHQMATSTEKRSLLFAQQAYRLISRSRMKNIDVQDLEAEITALQKAGKFNLYRFVDSYSK